MQAHTTKIEKEPYNGDEVEEDDDLSITLNEAYSRVTSPKRSSRTAHSRGASAPNAAAIQRAAAGSTMPRRSPRGSSFMAPTASSNAHARTPSTSRRTPSSMSTPAASPSLSRSTDLPDYVDASSVAAVEAAVAVDEDRLPTLTALPPSVAEPKKHRHHTRNSSSTRRSRASRGAGSIVDALPSLPSETVQEEVEEEGAQHHAVAAPLAAPAIAEEGHHLQQENKEEEHRLRDDDDDDIFARNDEEDDGTFVAEKAAVVEGVEPQVEPSVMGHPLPAAAHHQEEEEEEEGLPQVHAPVAEVLVDDGEAAPVQDAATRELLAVPSADKLLAGHSAAVEQGSSLVEQEEGAPAAPPAVVVEEEKEEEKKAEEDGKKEEEEEELVGGKVAHGVLCLP